MRIDSHQHFWSLARGDYHWMGDGPALAPIRRDVLPENMRPILKRHGIDKTVLVQAAATVEETEYMLGLADATDFVAKVVGWADFEQPSHRHHLERFAKHAKFSGVRPMIQDIADADWMFRRDVQWGYEALIDLDLTFDALGFPLHVDRFRRLIARYPKLRVVIDHCLKPKIRDGSFEDWARDMERLAEETTAVCKLSGLVTEARPDWTAETLQPYAAHILRVFGPQRVMWGSDWPVVDLAGGYDLWWQATETLLAGTEDADDILGGTAARFYRVTG
ncbi:MAG: amidohydrolase family protein [Hyphomicrobiaceae bacterium]